MSDQPLFQNMDEQEAIYAPDQLPPGDAERRLPTDDQTAGDVGATGAVTGRGASVPESGAAGSATGSTNRELNDTSGQT